MSSPYSDLLKLLAYAYRAKDIYLASRPHSRRALEHRRNFYQEVWRSAAAHLGATVESCGDDILEIRQGPTCTRVLQNSTTLDDPVTVSLAACKPLVHRLLRNGGLRVPTYLEFTLGELAKAVNFMHTLGGEWVVKPAASSGGRGVTVGIYRRSDFLRAALAAAAYGPNLLLEKRAEGDVYRLLYVDGKLLDAVLRKPPTVVGDGKSSVRQLVRRENEGRLNAGAKLGHVLLSIDRDMRLTLYKQGLSLASVPKSGSVVTLKTAINENSETDNVPATNLLCKSIIDDGAAAAAIVGVRLAGVDIVTHHPGVPLAESGGVILEVNAPPGFYYHYQQQSGCPVVVPILASLLRHQQNDPNASEKLSLVRNQHNRLNAASLYPIAL